MDFEVVNAGSAAALWAELDAASQRQEPIVLFSWTANFIGAVHDGKFIELPEDGEGCKDDPSWRSNPDLTCDCGNPENGYLKIGVWEGIPERWPGACKVVQQINFSNAEIAEMAKMADIDGMEPEEAADKWLADNEDKWRAWVDGVSG